MPDDPHTARLVARRGLTAVNAARLAGSATIGMPLWACRRRCAFIVAVLAAVWSAAGPAGATCNVIPGVSNTFRGARGSVDRPFASPDDVLALRLSPVCDESGPQLGDDAAALVASFVFTPPQGPRTLVVEAADCAALEPQLQRCRARGDLAAVHCIAARAAAEIAATAPADLSFTDDERGRRLEVRFPDTDALLAPDQDGHTLTGPLTIAVSRRDDALPCELASTPCRAQPGLVACIDELFRVDGTCDQAPNELFTHFTALPPPNDYQALCTEGPNCTGEVAELQFTVDADGNVLAPIRWSGVLVSDKLDLARLVRGSASIPAFADGAAPLRVPSRSLLHSYSPEGGLLPPIFEPQRDPAAAHGATLFGSTDGERGVLRIDRRSKTLQACAGGVDDALPCGADADCPDGACVDPTCVGGSRAGAACTADGECPEGECGASLFDFGSRLSGGVGPVVIARRGPGACEQSGTACTSDADCAGDEACAAFTFRSQNPVALDGLYESDSLLVSVVPEAFSGADLNGDGDQIDDVLLITDRVSGVRLPIGMSAEIPGRAVTRVNDPPFSFPAVAVDGDLVAFLEPEPLQGNVDLNGDGDRLDTILRVFRRGATGMEELTAGSILTADAAPLIDAASLAIAGGRVIFRSREADAVPRRVRRISVSSDGGEANGASAAPAISADGRQVAFESTATNLTAEPGFGVFVHWLEAGVTTALALREPLTDWGWGDVRVKPGSRAASPSLSGDGRFAAVSAPDLDGNKQVWLTDRDADGNGIFDEAAGVTTVLVSTDRNRQPGSDDSTFPFLTPSARLLSFASDSHSLHVDGATRRRNMWQKRDPLTDYLFITVDPDRNGIWPNDETLNQLSPMTPLGGMAFATPSNNLVDGDTNDVCLRPNGNTQCADVFVYSPLYFPQPVIRDNNEYYGLTAFDRVSIGDRGQQANQQSFAPAISWDNRQVAFISVASNLVPGDDNGVADVFLRDRRKRTTTRLSLASDRTQADGASYDTVLAMSADGRYVAFTSTAQNLAAASRLCDANGDGQATETCANVFLHDRYTGFTERLSSGLDGSAGDGASGGPAMSADGLTVAFRSRAANLVADDTNTFCRRLGHQANCDDVFVSAPDPAALATNPGLDLDGDGDLDDTVVRVFDPNTRTATTIGRAADVSVAGDTVAFLSPECDGGPLACRHGSDLNGDGDTDDLVAFVWHPGAAAENLGRDGQEIATSERWVAVVTARPQTTDVQENGPYTSLYVHRLADAGAQWIQVDHDAQDVRVAGGIVAFTEGEYQPNPLTGAHAFNGADRVLRLYDADRGVLRPVLRGTVGLAAQDFALGEHLVAFSEREGSRSTGAAGQFCIGNEDGDCLDRILQIYDVANDELISTGQAVTPCPVAACNPRQAFRVLDDTVRFLTLEASQNQDLNQDGDKDDLVLQSYNVRAAQMAATAQRRGGRPARALQRTRQAASGGVDAAPLTMIGAVTAGICTTTGTSCASANDCPSGGECYLPPGGCLVDVGAQCAFDHATPSGDGCTDGAFCQATGGGKGVCKRRVGPCSSDADCPAPARCSDRGTALQRLVAPLNDRERNGSEVFVGAGRCAEDLGTPCA
ncbi:MAG: hypothetical protein ABI629_19675, partial [bacterium]